MCESPDANLISGVSTERLAVVGESRSNDLQSEVAAVHALDADPRLDALHE